MRLVATDLDGTVVRPDGTISARTRRAFEACARRGVGVVFVTGRPPRWMPRVAEETGHRGLAICGNGAALYDLGRNEIVSTRALTTRAVHVTVEALRAALGEVFFAFETLAGPRWEHGYTVSPPAHQHNLLAQLHGWPGAVRGTVAELTADGVPVLKVLCRSPTHPADGMLEVARRVLNGIAEPVHSNPVDCLLEVSAPGVSKASSLALLADRLGVAAAQVVAFGDMPNDVDMLRWAGRSFAVADGHPEALAAATEVAPPCGEDGVAQVIEQLLAG
jgi:HAD superfamily hydrolase (TIGR01484 family)